MVEGIYGSVVFGRARGKINTFSDIERTYKGRYGAHMVHLRKPLLEWAGNDLLEIDFSIGLNGAWCGDPLPLLAEWHFYLENALAAPLVVGGKPLGPGLSLFIVEELSEHHKHWLPGGKLLAVELRVHFREYIPFAEGPLSALGISFFGAGAI